ncbi:vesicle-associated membrane protein 3 [Podarcis lilfordi]|uniref:Vesicle-associated membrane protein 3 n=1 Tax=Podarcis lilfordi TaxID=74358 RepID=A0AA35PBZ6_9SAUR|nr:vesicle-associated membrane protein 3 [Podarcis lilfordi]
MVSGEAAIVPSSLPATAVQGKKTPQTKSFRRSPKKRPGTDGAFKCLQGFSAAPCRRAGFQLRGLRSRRRLAASPSSASCSWGWGLSPAGGAELPRAPPSGRACKSCSPKRHQQQPREQKLFGESRCCATTSPNVTMSTSGPSGAAAAPGSIRLQQTQNQVDEVVDIMRVNVDKVLERDEKLSVLDDRVDALQAGAAQFETNAAKLKRKYWWKNCKMWAILIAVVVVLLIIIIVWSVSS